MALATPVAEDAIIFFQDPALYVDTFYCNNIFVELKLYFVCLPSVQHRALRILRLIQIFREDSSKEIEAYFKPKTNVLTLMLANFPIIMYLIRI